jgi:galactosamine-6-phosphate isomerase
MNLQLFASPEELAEQASEHIIDRLRNTGEFLICTATGNSTTLTYKKLVEKRQRYSTEHLKVVKLDEWGGIPLDYPQTCETYLWNHLLRPLHIAEDQFLGFISDTENPAEECRRVQDRLDQEGPIDLCILGIGLNGHIAFNEPAAFLQPHCHIAKLSEKALNHPMAKEMGAKPTYGLTLGMADILNSKEILLLISGASKAEITRDFMQRRISTELPASFLWLHPNVHCLCDREAFSLAVAF